MPQKPSQSYSDGHSYIPPHVQEAMTKQMEHMAPAHMKQYAGAFVQQQTNQGRSAPVAGKVSGPPPTYRPVTHLPRKDHFHQFKAQKPSIAETFAADNSAPAPQPAPQQTVYPEQQYQQPTQQQYPSPQVSAPQPNANPDYDFFMSGQQPPQQKFNLPGRPSSPWFRIGLAAGGLIILLIIFNVVKGLLAGPSNYPYYLSVIQDQQSIVHLTTNALEQDGLNTDNSNFAITAQTSIKSSQTDLVKLVSSSGKKINTKQAILKTSTTNDTRLTQAAASGNYNTTFNEIMQDQLKAYKNDLNTVYDKTKSASSRALLQDQYKQADLLVQQLGTTSASD